MSGQLVTNGILNSDWGYAKYYKPELERSMKNRLYNELGANYKFARPHEDVEMVVAKDWIAEYKRDNEYNP